MSSFWGWSTSASAVSAAFSIINCCSLARSANLYAAAVSDTPPDAYTAVQKTSFPLPPLLLIPVTHISKYAFHWEQVPRPRARSDGRFTSSLPLVYSAYANGRQKKQMKRASIRSLELPNTFLHGLRPVLSAGSSLHGMRRGRVRLCGRCVSEPLAARVPDRTQKLASTGRICCIRRFCILKNNSP